MRILIRDAYIICMDQKNTIIKQGNIAVDGGKIASVGDTPQSFVPQRVIDAGGKLAIPGLINAHTHIPMTFFRGYGNDLELFSWLSEKIWPAEDRLKDGDCAVGTRVGMAEMLLSGTTCFADMYMFEEEIAEEVGWAGMRASLARGVTALGDPTQGLMESERLAASYSGAFDGRISVMIAPHAVYTNTEESILAQLEMAKRYGAGIHVHLSETEKENDDCLKAHNMSPTEYLYSLGVFTVPVLAAHCVALSDTDMDIMSCCSASAVHCPASNLKLASGIAKCQRMISHGVNVAIGTDGASSNNRLDMMGEMRMAALLGKMAEGDPTALDAQTALRMATINGAEALGIAHKTGSIEEGKDADIVLVDMDSPHFSPRRDVLAQLVYAADQSDVCMTMVRGEVLMEKRRLLTLDLQRDMAELERICERLY